MRRYGTYSGSLVRHVKTASNYSFNLSTILMPADNIIPNDILARNNDDGWHLGFRYFATNAVTTGPATAANIAIIAIIIIHRLNALLFLRSSLVSRFDSHCISYTSFSLL